MRTYIRQGLFETAVQEDKGALLAWKKELNSLSNPTTVYYDFNLILKDLLENLPKSCNKQNFQEYFKFIVSNIDLPNTLVEEIHEKLTNKKAKASLRQLKDQFKDWLKNILKESDYEASQKVTFLDQGKAIIQEEVAINSLDNQLKKALDQLDDGAVQYKQEQLLQVQIKSLKDERNGKLLTIAQMKLESEICTINQELKSSGETIQQLPGSCKENRKQLLNYVQAKQQLFLAIPTAKPPDNNFFIPSNRKPGSYSNSEEEDAPHFNGVYNLAKHRVFDINNASNDNGSLVDNYVTNYEEILRDILVKDAQAINPDSNASQYKSPITTLCVALRQKDGRIKKFVFTNQPSMYQYDSTTETMQSISDSAHAKDYHVIMAQQAHAEGEFMQFLQERPTRYTHILGMGCSRKHCQLCNAVLIDLIGPHYRTLSGNLVDDYTFDNWHIPLALENVLNAHGHAPKVVKKEKTAKIKNDSWSDQQDHKELAPEDWENRPWKKIQANNNDPKE